MQPNQYNAWLVGLVSLLACAMASEAVALLALASDAPIEALAWHVVAALTSALAGARTASGGPDARPEFAVIVAGAFVLTLPALGLLGLTWVLLPHWLAARRQDPDGVLELELELPEFHESDVVEFDSERATPIEEDLSPERPLPQRIGSVMSLRRMDPQRAVPLLRIALGDPSEDVRLLAYAILERREKQIRRRITRALEALNDPAEERLPLLRELANDHWELVYGGFSEGEGQKLNLEQAARWATDALRESFDGTTAVLLARVLLKQGDGAAAWRMIVAAERAGVATNVCRPLLAEAAFLLRDFSYIPRLLAHVDGNPLQAPRLQPVARFWNAGGLR